MKLLSVFLLFFSVLLFADGDILSLGTQDAWQRVNGKGELSFTTTRKGINIFTVKGKVNYRSKTTLEISPDKFYKLSGDFRAAPGSEPASIYFGVIPYDKDMERIESGQVNIVPETMTVLVKDVKKGDTSLIAADASAWKNGSSYAVSFNADEEYSDLPNRSIITIKSIRQTGEAWEITLNKAVSADYPAGCKIRQHQHGSTYPYNGAASKVSGKWQTFSILINGEALYGLPHVKWWHGTRNAGIIMLVNYGGTDASEMQIRNVVLEELTR